MLGLILSADLLEKSDRRLGARGTRYPKSGSSLRGLDATLAENSPGDRFTLSADRHKITFDRLSTAVLDLDQMRIVVGNAPEKPIWDDWWDDVGTLCLEQLTTTSDSDQLRAILGEGG